MHWIVQTFQHDFQTFQYDRNTTTSLKQPIYLKQVDQFPCVVVHDVLISPPLLYRKLRSVMVLKDYTTKTNKQYLKQDDQFPPVVVHDVRVSVVVEVGVRTHSARLLRDVASIEHLPRLNILINTINQSYRLISYFYSPQTLKMIESTRHHSKNV